jgi:SAM-dependent methyltransferase
METSVQADRSARAAGTAMSSIIAAIRWGLDRMLSVGYGIVYDYIFERFKPYRELQREVLELVCAGTETSGGRRSVQVADIGCGPGNFTFVLAEAGFSVVVSWSWPARSGAHAGCRTSHSATVTLPAATRFATGPSTRS